MHKLITGRNHYYAPACHIVMVMDITGVPSEGDLYDAIQKAAHKHEIFSDKIILDKNGDSFCVPMLPRNIVLKKIESNRKEGLKQFIKEQQRIPFDFINGELVRFFYLEDKEKTQFLIVANHLAGDGMSIIFLIRDIMVALNNPVITYEPQPLKLMEDFGYPKDSDLKPVLRFLLRQINRQWNNQKIFSYQEYLDMFYTYWKDRQIEMINATICDLDLKNLLSKCKKMKITINSAITAAFLFALKEDKIGMPVNVRPKSYEGMGNYASGISIKYRWDNHKSFWNNAESVHKTIYKKLSSNRKKYHVLQSLKEIEPTLIDAVYFCKYADFHNKTALKTLNLFKYNEEKQLEMGITNLAKPEIPSIYGKYSINAIEFIPPLIPVNRTVLGVVTIAEKMTISMQYDDNKKINSKDYGKAFEEAICILKNSNC